MPTEAAHTESTPAIDRSEPDLAILDNQRASVPVGLSPHPWAVWIAETERAVGAPADYIPSARSSARGEKPLSHFRKITVMPSANCADCANHETH